MTTELEEIDSSGKVVATYLSSENRLDIVKPKHQGSLINELWHSTLTVFLPVGYPNSVTPDYMRYQIYDSLQAFSSSIAGLLSSRAVLEGVGVGNAHASPTGAILLTILQESAGRIATVLFAHRLGTALEPECKTWRLAADVFNDLAMVLDCLSPALPKGPRVALLSGSSCLRALCGVAAGSAKASLSMHFARWGNLGEVNAKDSSQETVISLLGMLAGGIVVNYISTPRTTWPCLLLLLAVHLAMNHAAVRAVAMHTLNRQRANLVLSALFDSQDRSNSQDRSYNDPNSNSSSSTAKETTLHTPLVLSPEAVSAQERIFERDGVLRWRGGPVLGWARIGVRLRDLATMVVGREHGSTGAITSGGGGRDNGEQSKPGTEKANTGAEKSDTGTERSDSGRTEARPPSLRQILSHFSSSPYVLYCAPNRHAAIVLKEGISAREQLRAWAHALLAVERLARVEEEGAGKAVTGSEAWGAVVDTGVWLEGRWKDVERVLGEEGWDLDAAVLETGAGGRVRGDVEGGREVGVAYVLT